MSEYRPAGLTADQLVALDALRAAGIDLSWFVIASTHSHQASKKWILDRLMATGGRHEFHISERSILLRRLRLIQERADYDRLFDRHTDPISEIHRVALENYERLLAQVLYDPDGDVAV